MKIDQITVKVTTAWWYRWLYLPGLVMFCRVMRLVYPDIEPDKDKIKKWVKRAIKIQPKRRK